MAHQTTKQKLRPTMGFWDILSAYGTIVKSLYAILYFTSSTRFLEHNSVTSGRMVWLTGTSSYVHLKLWFAEFWLVTFKILKCLPCFCKVNHFEVSIRLFFPTLLLTLPRCWLLPGIRELTPSTSDVKQKQECNFDDMKHNIFKKKL